MHGLRTRNCKLRTCSNNSQLLGEMHFSTIKRGKWLDRVDNYLSLKMEVGLNERSPTYRSQIEFKLVRNFPPLRSADSVGRKAERLNGVC